MEEGFVVISDFGWYKFKIFAIFGRESDVFRFVLKVQTGKEE
jgi:hypothetical protein